MRLNSHHIVPRPLDMGRVTTTMHFMQRDNLFEEVKPYSLRYDPPNDLPRTNIKLQREDQVHIDDVRGYEQDFHFDDFGFAFIPLHTTLSYDDFRDTNKITQVYLREVAKAVQEFLHADYVQIFEHTVKALNTRLKSSSK